MLSKQNNYDFKSELLIVHKKDVRDFSLSANTDEFAFFDRIEIAVKNFDDEVIMTAVRDFEDYLFTSMSISAFIKKGESKTATINIALGENLGEAEGYMGYRITTTKDGIELLCHDARGVAQGLYYLEDLMNIRKAPFIKIGKIERKALFSPRITQSPFGMYEWNDNAFQILAHRGFDAIDLWVTDPWTNKRGEYIDIRLITERAKKYGIDVYVELYAPHTAHPDDEGAQEFYDNLYSTLFDVCPIIKGVTVVGEATNFPSRDPRVGLSPHPKNFVDNIPTGKISPGWFPCSDYPEWIEMIKKAVRKKRADADYYFGSLRKWAGFWTGGFAFAKEGRKLSQGSTL